MNRQHLERLAAFILRLRGEVYPESPSDLHNEITRRALKYLVELFPLSPGLKVLDVGCGQGPAATWFVQHGCEYRGVTLSEEEVVLGRSNGFQVDTMDQSFLDYPDQSFDLVWARHVLEHSPFPLFTLEGFRRVLKPGGFGVYRGTCL